MDEVELQTNGKLSCVNTGKWT